MDEGVKIFGTRGEIKESTSRHSYKSGVLIDNKILLDGGEKEFLSYNPAYILLTHLHPDHAYFVRDQDVAPANVLWYAPEKYDNNLVQVVHEPFYLEDYKIIPIPTVHSIKVKSNAYK